jgi:two-component system, NtrC family, response regulator AtoC
VAGQIRAESSPLRPVILVVDDDPGVRESFRLILDDHYDVLDAADGRGALQVLQRSPVDLVLLDIRMPEIDGLQLLAQIKALDEQLEVVLVTAVKTVRTAVEAMKLGAFDYLTKPFDEDDLLTVVRRALERRSLEREVVFLRSELARQHDFDELVGQHPEMQKLYRLIGQVARNTATVLIVGESGTGKEIVARAIHRQGPRRDHPFVVVNPAAIPETLIESELFGHEKGAFTGAHQRKIGKFEMAAGGTLFLDEIGTLKPELQVKLLRVLQEREIERVGGTQVVRADVRILAATNSDLRRAVATGAFREDLYYRLNVVRILVPPLRERREDIPHLVEHFVRRYNHHFSKRIEGISPEALAVLHRYSWPGNVRELQNIVERSVALVDGGIIGPSDLPVDLFLPDLRDSVRQAETLPLREATDEFERQIVTRVLQRVRWNQSEAARILGLHRNVLKAKLARWGLAGSGREEAP